MANRSRSRPKPAVNPKVGQIQRAARHLFLQHGYGATSMDAVALRSGVSKATLYVYYRSKKALFAEIVNNFSIRYSAVVVDEDTPDEDIRITLLRMGHSILTLLLAKDAVSAHRMVVAEAGRSPELGKLYYESGPARLLNHLENILARAMRDGHLRNAPPRRAAEQFIGLVRGNLQLRAIMCVGRAASERAKNGIVNSGVDVFYRAYAPTRPASAGTAPAGPAAGGGR